MLPQHLHCGIQLCLRNISGPGQDNGGSSLDLVVVELTEVLHINLHLAGIRHGNRIAQRNVVSGDPIHSPDHIGKLAHTGGLDQDPVRRILRNDPLQCLAEVTHQRAADAAGIHFRNVDARILQESAVNADLAELVLNEHQLLTLVPLADHLLDEGSFARAEEAGININLCHK